MGDENYAESQNPPSPYANKNSKTSPGDAQRTALPEVRVTFFVLSSVTTKKIDELVKNQVSFARVVWKPKDDDLKKFEVNLTWDGTYKVIDDKDKAYRRIDFFNANGSPKALKLVQANYSNPEFNAEIPVFVCETAWDELNEPGNPRDGLLKGFTLVKTLPWFSGERSILLFASTVASRTLAHEMSHWLGYSHSLYREDPGNIAAIGATGITVDRDQFRKLYRWATEKEFRKKLATK